MSMANQTTVTEFILLGLFSDPQLQTFLFLVFLVIYLSTLGGNVAIMLVTRADSHLGTPMYFLLSHLSFSDICFSSVTVPKMLETLLSERKTISVSCCFAQMFFLLLSGCSEVFILSAMAYDRYAAICDPLRYMRTMSKRVCSQLVAGAWLIGSLYALINTLPLLALHFCGPNTINHFSCELPSLVALSCSETFTNNMVFLTSALTIGLVSFSLTLGSYIHILTTILRIRSVEGRRKAFSTCSSHLIVVGLCYGTGLFRHFRPNSVSSVVLDGLVSIQYSILTPMLNPLIYSLKNKEVKAALRRLLGGKNHPAPR
ncbi:olfactory receptor 8S1-like [Terrapene carolina triunguis]|uniref:olfactory receptor 8S1-like n=1 Tax=Terrapene triunguis TaxID=2587831 RepID=UPI000E77F399|nr:olfactory receptor 8S1-like [Terrapene carolina triunguis]